MKSDYEPLVSVIIPASDCLRLEWTLAALVRQTYTQPFEVIVVNDGRDDGMREMAERALESRYHEYVYLPPDGPDAPFRPSAARNAGIRASRGQWIAFLDQDTVPGWMWLETMMKRARPRRLLFSFRTSRREKDVRPFTGSLSDMYFRMGLSLTGIGRFLAVWWDYLYLLGTTRAALFASCACLVDARTLCAFGGFDEVYDGAWSGEDFALACRMEDAGVELVPVLHRHAWSVHLDHPAYPRRPGWLKKRYAVLRRKVSLRDLPPIIRESTG